MLFAADLEDFKDKKYVLYIPGNVRFNDTCQHFMAHSRLLYQRRTHDNRKRCDYLFFALYNLSKIAK
jgi:hypothetical protein